MLRRLAALLFFIEVAFTICRVGECIYGNCVRSSSHPISYCECEEGYGGDFCEQTCSNDITENMVLVVTGVWIENEQTPGAVVSNDSSWIDVSPVPSAPVSSHYTFSSSSSSSSETEIYSTSPPPSPPPETYSLAHESERAIESYDVPSPFDASSESASSDKAPHESASGIAPQSRGPNTFDFTNDAAEDNDSTESEGDLTNEISESYATTADEEEPSEASEDEEGESETYEEGPKFGEPRMSKWWNGWTAASGIVEEAMIHVSPYSSKPNCNATNGMVNETGTSYSLKVMVRRLCKPSKALHDVSFKVLSSDSLVSKYLPVTCRNNSKGDVGMVWFISIQCEISNISQAAGGNDKGCPFSIRIDISVVKPIKTYNIPEAVTFRPANRIIPLHFIMNPPLGLYLSLSIEGSGKFNISVTQKHIKTQPTCEFDATPQYLTLSVLNPVEIEGEQKESDCGRLVDSVGAVGAFADSPIGEWEESSHKPLISREYWLSSYFLNSTDVYIGIKVKPGEDLRRITNGEFDIPIFVSVNVTIECDPPCVHGYCEQNEKATSQCICLNGWGGELCNLPDCTPACVHGACSESNKCSCWDGWTGPYCMEIIHDIGTQKDINIVYNPAIRKWILFILACVAIFCFLLLVIFSIVFKNRTAKLENGKTRWFGALSAIVLPISSMMGTFGASKNKNNSKIHKEEEDDLL